MKVFDELTEPTMLVPVNMRHGQEIGRVYSINEAIHKRQRVYASDVVIVALFRRCIFLSLCFAPSIKGFGANRDS
jgi:hypothetical protein